MTIWTFGHDTISEEKIARKGKVEGNDKFSFNYVVFEVFVDM